MRLAFIYRDHPIRQIALNSEPNDPSNYVLYGARELKARGHQVELFIGKKQEGLINKFLSKSLGEKVDYCGILNFIGLRCDFDVIVITSHSYLKVFLVLKKIGLIRSKLCWIVIGFENRVDEAGQKDALKWVQMLKNIDGAICFGWGEQNKLFRWLGASKSVFMPFGVPVKSLQQIQRWVGEKNAENKEIDVVSIGSDPQRDFSMVLSVASVLLGNSFHIVAGKSHRQVLAQAPFNVTVEYQIPFYAMLETMRKAKVVLLCCKENNYSGATTVLLQAMGMGKAVVATRTQAIVDGYGWENGKHGFFVEPGNATEATQKVKALLSDSALREEIGIRAKKYVEANMDWSLYVEKLEKILEKIK